MTSPGYDDCVFLNVPFDRKYEALLRALVFTVHDCGFIARCAREIEDGGQVRLDKIYRLIAQSRYGIHDLSRTGLDRIYRLPRFNMPLELGIFLGATKFGVARQREKRCLILDRDRDRYQRFCSDIAGQEIQPHAGRTDEVIRGVRNWLSSQMAGREIQVPGPSRIIERYGLFLRDLPSLCTGLQLHPPELLFNEYTRLVVGWIKANPWQPPPPAATARPR